ncbi:MAG: ABC transporter ATP-binding protein [Nitrosomonas sp.]|nr:ABC transporter ATP-binding protein [Nitrosomonas sp.]
MSETKSIHLLINWCKPYQVFFWLVAAILLIVGVSSATLPLVAKALLDHMLDQDQETMMVTMFTLICIISVRTIANYFADFILRWIAGKLSTDLQTLLLEKALALPVYHFEQHDLKQFYIDHIANILKIADLSTRVFWGQVKEILIFTGLVAIMFYINRDAAVLGIFLILVTVLIAQILNKGPNHRNSQSLAITKSSDLFQQIMKHIRSIKIDESSFQEKSNFYQRLEKQRISLLKPIIGNFLGKLLAIIVFSLMLIAVFYYLLHQYHLHKLALSEMIAMIVAFGLLAPASVRFLNRIAEMDTGRIALQQLNEFLSLQTQPPKEGIALGTMQGALVIENLKPQGHDSLTDSSSHSFLTIQPKDVVALTAANPGVLKSMLDCVLRFNQPHSGRIMLDGIDIATLKSEEIGTKVAWISPDMPLLEDTLAANIAYGTMHCATEAQLTAIARVSHVADFAREMPYGLQTRINKDGLTSSEALKQCVLLARALLKNPAIVIIDESFAEFELSNEKVDHALDVLIQGRTSIIISTRQPMIQKAQKMVCIDDLMSITSANNYSNFL